MFLHPVMKKIEKKKYLVIRMHAMHFQIKKFTSDTDNYIPSSLVTDT